MATRAGDGRRRHDGPRQHPPGDPRPGPLAGGLHGRLRQQRAPEPRRPEDRRPPGVELVGRDGPDVPLLRVHARRRPNRHQAATRRPSTTRSSTCWATWRPSTCRRCGGCTGCRRTPSRTKDPDGVDFSAGPVGLGAVAPNFASLTETYARARLDPETRVERRYISLLGDAELDEGVVWGGYRRPRRGRGGEHSLGHRPQPTEPRPRHPRHPRPGVARDVRRERVESDRRQVR